MAVKKVEYVEPESYFTPNMLKIAEEARKKAEKKETAKQKTGKKK